MTYIKFIGVAAVLALSACSSDTTELAENPSQVIVSEINPPVDSADAFTYANYQDVRATHLDLNLDVNFDRKVLDGSITIDFERVNEKADTLVLDTQDLTIESVETLSNGTWTIVSYGLSKEDPVLGQALSVPLSGTAEKVRIEYETSPNAKGLQWLSPSQTAGKTHPYMFSQGQPIYARTMAPVQDTPAVRVTYSAKLTTPPELIALMSASQDPNTPRDGEYEFEMPQPIPVYLLAFAVGDIEFKAINDHIGVYSEKYILDAAAEEFSETPDMEKANIELYGPYRWGRYDLIVLPPSFPYGGMENPRLSFLTPTLVAGDKSLTNVVAHELAHSWSGNLVTNATWRDSWLNEGFTSYVENRIMEALYGKDRAVMEQVLDMQNLKRALSEAPSPAYTHLKLPENMTNLDDAFSLVSYLKGANFLFFLEDRFGRERFDPFLADYFDTYAFQSVTTEEFLKYLDDNLLQQFPDVVSNAEINAWVYGPGLPETVRKPVSNAFVNVDKARSDWLAGNLSLENIPTAKWSTHEWLHFLNNMPSDVSIMQLTELDGAYGFTGTSNAETAFAWYMLAINTGYEPALLELENFLMTVGRGKFIYRLYGALKSSGQSEWAKRVYTSARPGYNPIAQDRIDAIFAK